MLKNVCLLACGLCLLGAAAFGVAYAQDAAQEEVTPKHQIKDVMQKAHRDGLLKKVAGGEASEAERMELLDLYVSLYECKPPMGDEAAWKGKTSLILAAVGKVVVGREGAAAELTKAANCAACHREHRPPQE
jgi:hypothetical protein